MKSFAQVDDRECEIALLQNYFFPSNLVNGELTPFLLIFSHGRMVTMKTSLITGASTGIGRATAITFAEKNYHV